MEEEIKGLLEIAYFAPLYKGIGQNNLQVYITGQMMDGKRHGPWKFLSEDGTTLLKRQEYENGILREEEIFTAGGHLECTEEIK